MVVLADFGRLLVCCLSMAFAQMADTAGFVIVVDDRAGIFRADYTYFYWSRSAVQYHFGPPVSFAQGSSVDSRTDELYTGMIGGLGIAARTTGSGHDCARGMLVKAPDVAMVNESRSKDEYVSSILSGKMSGRAGIVLASLDYSAPPARFNWCKSIVEGIYYCEADAISLMMASGNKF